METVLVMEQGGGSGRRETAGTGRKPGTKCCGPP
jgi:hypothetical protein